MRTCAKVAAGVGTVYFAPRGSSGARLDRLRTSFVGQYRKVKDPSRPGLPSEYRLVNGRQL